MENIFKSRGVSGRYPEELDETAAERLGAAFAGLLKAKKIAVGRDMRLSSPPLARAFIEGALKTGAAVTDIGMVTTPALYFSVVDGKHDGGVMVTGSHLPGDRNGFLFCREKAMPLNDDGRIELQRIFEETAAPVAETSSRQSYRAVAITPDYLHKLKKHVLQTAPYAVVADFGNGMAGAEVRHLFHHYSTWSLTPLFAEPDGRFPNHPADPLLPSSTLALQERVLQEHADFGIAFDGDADSCVFVDEQGRRIAPDIIAALLADHYLTLQPGAPVVFDLRSSRIVPEVITRMQGQALRSEAAEIANRMRSANALFAAAPTGHYYYREMDFTDNAVFTLLQVLNILAAELKSLSELTARFKKYFSTGETVIRVAEPQSILGALENRYGDAQLEHIDGLTVEYGSWWFHLRPSDSGPLLHLRIEADQEQTAREKQEEILSFIRTKDPDMTLVS